MRRLVRDRRALPPLTLVRRALPPLTLVPRELLPLALVPLALGALAACAAPGPGSPEDPMSAQEFLDARLAAGTTAWVSATLIDDGERARLCDAVMESYPPQCGGPDLFVEGFTDLPLEEASGVRWTEWGTFEVEVVRHDRVRVEGFNPAR